MQDRGLKKGSKKFPSKKKQFNRTMKSEKDIDNLFKDLIEDSEMNHSSKIWETLESHLDKKDQKRDKAVIYRQRIAISALIIILCTFLAYHVFNLKNLNSSEISNNNLHEKSSRQNLLSFPNSDKNTKETPSQKSDNINATQSRKFQQNEVKLQKSEMDKKDFVKQKNNNTVTAYINNNYNLLDLENNSLRIPDTNKAGLITDLINSTTDISNEGAITKGINQDSTIISAFINTLSPSSNSITATLTREMIDSIQKSKVKNKLSVITYFSPDFTQKYMKDNNVNDNQNEGDYNNQEVPDLSYSGGFLLGYDLNKNISLRTGLSYASLIQTIKPKTIYAGTSTDGTVHYQFNTSYGTSDLPRDQSPAPVIGDSLRIHSNTSQSLQMLSVPLAINYQITKRKLSYYGQLGLSCNFLLSEKLIVETPYKTETITKIEGLNEYFFSGIMGLGIKYNLIKKLSVFVEPNFRGALTPINKNTPITTRPLSFGLGVGFIWHL